MEGARDASTPVARPGERPIPRSPHGQRGSPDSREGRSAFLGRRAAPPRVATQFATIPCDRHDKRRPVEIDGRGGVLAESKLSSADRAREGISG